jgi:hypothetical protein
LKKNFILDSGRPVLIGITYLLVSSFKNRNKTGEAFAIQGQEHIDTGFADIEYNSNPPSSGSHYGESAKWGVYQNELPDEILIHNLEHGGIWISYKDIDEATKVALEEIAKTGLKIILEPRAKNDAPIVLVSWGRVQKFQSFDRQAILDFIKANTNKSPEPFAR